MKNRIWDLYRRLRDESPLPRLIFYIGFTIELLMVIVDKSNFVNPIEGWLFRVTFLLFAAKLLLTKYELREWVLPKYHCPEARCIVGATTISCNKLKCLSYISGIFLYDQNKRSFGEVIFGGEICSIYN